MQAGDILGHEFMGEVVEVGAERDEPLGGRPRRRAVPDRLRRLLLLPARASSSLCDNIEPERRDGRGALRLLRRRAVRLLPPLRRLRRRPGRARPRAVRRRRAAQGAGDASPTSRRCSSPTSSRPATWRPRTAPSGRATPWRCGAAGPVGLLAIKSAFLLGAERVIAHRPRARRGCALAETHGKAETLDYEETDDVVEELKQRTGGRGPDACIDAVGMEAHGTTARRAATTGPSRPSGSATDRPHALRQAHPQACRKGGTVSVPGVYGGFLDKVPFGAAFAKGLTLRDGPDPRPPLPAAAARAASRPGELDPELHHEPPAARWTRAPEAYRDVQRQGRRLHEGRPDPAA